MKTYVYASAAGHALLLTAAVVWGTLLAKPRLSYYAVEMLSGTPMPPAAPAPQAPPTEKPVEDVPAQPEPKSVMKEVIKLNKKEPKKLPKATPKPTPAPPKPSISGALRSLAGTAATPSAVNQGLPGANVVATASGPSFPYPWYLKMVSDKLDQHWKPLGESTCQVTFTIARGGRVSGEVVRKSSGDLFFDQTALRAVQDSSPMPPLPNGYPEETLRVHMTFTGNR